MRGKDSVTLYRDHVVRITPAYAGKRALRTLEAKLKKDHPRLCGEKFFRRISTAQLPGSPPPMRGKDGKRYSGNLCSRITPAYAGKRLLHPTFHNRHEDHPRLCGEKPHTIPVDQLNAGSPPPMRGKGCLYNHDTDFRRITPAYAGKRNCQRC